MPFYRINIDGHLGGGVERWSVGFAAQQADGETSFDAGQMSAWADDALALFIPGTGWSGGLRAMIGSTGEVSRVRIYAYDAPGQPATRVGESTGPGIAGSGTVTVPFQCTLCYTLLTGLPGRSYRGRLYWPFVTATMTSAGKIGGAVSLANRAGDVSGMLDAITSAAEGISPVRAAVVSTVQQDVTTVTAVRVGDVMDTQRRRRDALVETTAVSAVS